LTGLFARHGFDVEGQRRLGALARAGRSCAVVLFECGAPDRSVSGDDLRAVGRLLAGCVKSGDVVARFGGPSFALLVETDSAALVSEKIEDLIQDRAALSALSDTSGDDQACAGIAFSDSQAGEPLDELLARAGLALAQAKRQGRRRVVVAEPMKKVMPC
jgi:diguanylate cyclase (GGDEF)-like protein